MRTKVTVELSARFQSATCVWEKFESLKDVLDILPKIIEEKSEYFNIANSGGYTFKVKVTNVEECNHCPAHMCASPHSGERCKCITEHREIPRSSDDFPTWCPLKADDEEKVQ